MQWLIAIFIIPYLIVLLKIYGSMKRASSFKSFPTPFFKISVIIPCRNEGKNLPYILGDLSFQDYPPDFFEVIVVDDNSTDGTLSSVLSEKRIRNLIVVKNTGAGKKDALRCGIDVATSGLIITTDADCRMGKKWISTIACFYNRGRQDLIIGPVKLSSRAGFLGRFQELEFMALQGVTYGTATAGQATMCNGANLAFPRSTYYDNAGNLHPEIQSGDDIFLLHSIKKGKRAVIEWLGSDEAVVETAQASLLKDLLRQRRRWLAKSRVYTDIHTVILGLVVFIPVALILFTLAASFFNSRFIPVAFFLYLLKSVPDYLILKETTDKYRSPELMKWFIPAELVYPFYVAIVAIMSVRKGRNT